MVGAAVDGDHPPYSGKTSPRGLESLPAPLGTSLGRQESPCKRL